MSVEPPPPDRVRSDTAFRRRRSILDGEDTRRARSRVRVDLGPVPPAPILEDGESPWAGTVDPRYEAQRAETASLGAALMATLHKEWDDFAFTTVRRSRLITFVGFVAVLVLAAYGWQRGVLSGVTAEFSGDHISADGAPAAPRLSSDQVAWGDTWDEADGDARRSTASFSSERAFAEEDDDASASGAKLFVADGKKSSKGRTSGQADQGSSAGAADEPGPSAATGTGSGDPPASDKTSRRRTETTSETAVRYESCAEAAAAGAAPIRLGQPGYRLSLDLDKDGIACENGSAAEDPGDAPVDSLYSDPTTTTAGGSGSTTTATITGAGTTSTVESTTTSFTSTTGSSTTSTTTETSRSTSTTSSTTSTSLSTTSTAGSSSSTSTSSSTTSTRPSTTTTATTSTTISTTTTTTTTTSSTTTPSTASTVVDPPPIDPIRPPGGRRSGLGLI